ncbi:MAG: hypothetical protein ABL997_16185, partial [Planctomycetota bacterium]
MTKKLVALVCVLGLVTSLWWFGGVPPLASENGEPPPPAPMPVAAETATKRASTNEPEQKTDEARIAAQPVDTVEPEPSPTELWGRVVDAATKK